jgi:hypothetical protein
LDDIEVRSRVTTLDGNESDFEFQIDLERSDEELDSARTGKSAIISTDSPTYGGTSSESPIDFDDRSRTDSIDALPNSSIEVVVPTIKLQPLRKKSLSRSALNIGNDVDTDNLSQVSIVDTNNNSLISRNQESSGSSETVNVGKRRHSIRTGNYNRLFASFSYY